MTTEIKKDHSKNSTSRYEAASTSNLTEQKSPQRDTVKLINETKEIVERLMQYAIRNPDIVVSAQLLKTVIPLLRKDSENFSNEDEIALWTSHNELTQMVKPVSHFSLLIAEQLNAEIDHPDYKRSWLNLFKFWQKTRLPSSNVVNKCHKELRIIFIYLISSVMLYVLIQGYCVLLSDTITHVEEHQAKWIAQYQLVQNKQASGEKVGFEKDEAQRRINQLASSAQILVHLTDIFATPIGRRKCGVLPGYAENMRVIHEVQQIDVCISVRKHYGKVTYTILANYILPLILGILGATASIVRNILEKLENDSYLPGAEGKLSMRLCLGGLLGVISGIFIASDQEELTKFNINLVMVSLVMGYSVEVAFSLFDSVVERMKDWAQSLKKQ